MKGDRERADALKDAVIHHAKILPAAQQASLVFLVGALWMLPAAKALRLLHCLCVVLGLHDDEIQETLHRRRGGADDSKGGRL